MAAYVREYRDITETLTFEEAGDGTLEAILPDRGRVEVKMNTPRYKFRVFRREGEACAELTDGYTHYACRYTGEPACTYFLRAAEQSDTPMEAEKGPLALRCYTYTDTPAPETAPFHLRGKRIAVIGDSIVQGRYSRSGAKVNAVVPLPWSHLVALACGTEPANFGIGGALVTDTDWKSLYRNCRLVAGFDLVLVAAGTNDYGNHIPGDRFSAAFGHVLATLKENNAAVTVCTPVTRTSRTGPNEVGLTLADYAAEEIRLARTHGLPVIDLLPLTDTPEFIAALSDGLHPGQNGHGLIARLVLEHL